MGAYAAVASRPVLPEPVQDVSSNSKYERTTKGAAAMGAIKVPSKTVEYVLFPAERHFRHLRRDEARDAHRFKRYYKEGERGGQKEGRIRGARNEETTEESEMRKTSAFSMVRDNLLSRILEGRSVCHWMESRVPLITTTLFRPINKRSKQTAII